MVTVSDILMEMASDERMRKPMRAAIIVEMKLIWLFLGMSRLSESVKCFAVVAATTRARMPIE
jgi:hypothetical protein